MKLVQILGCSLLVGSILTSPLTGFGADHNQPGSQVAKKLKPYPLKTCLVSGEKLGEMGKPFEMAYKDRDGRVTQTGPPCSLV